MRRRWSTWFLLCALVLAAAAFRFYGLAWDGLIGAHPDERYVVDAAARLSFPGGLNPFTVAPDYAYGHLPLYLLAAAHGLVSGVDPLLVGRALSALFDVGTVALTFALGRRVYGERVGLLGAAFVAVMAAHVQEAHFYTADTLLAFFSIAALFFAVRFAGEGRAVDACLAGGAAGLALGSKATAGLLAVPLGLACWSAPDGREQGVWRCGVATGAAFLLVDPFAVIELPTFLGNLARQGAVLRGALDVPYTRQYHRTLPYVYPVMQQLRWGMGWLMGTGAFAGLAYEAARVVRRSAPGEVWVLLAWVVPFFSFVGGLYAKFPRYLLPILPVLAIYAAHLIDALDRWRRGLLVGLSALVLGALLLRCGALVGMYRAPHPWAAASEWFYEEVEPGATVAVEAWDHPLPVDASDYALVELPVFDEETEEKWVVMEERLAEAEYVVVASRRGYASLGRWPARHGRTLRYYERLFEGELGFEPVACFTRYPRLGPLALADDPTSGLAFSLPDGCEPASRWARHLGRLDESYVVYDHPRVVVFKEVGG